MRRARKPATAPMMMTQIIHMLFPCGGCRGS
jgi:hypothetical protein